VICTRLVKRITSFCSAEFKADFAEWRASYGIEEVDTGGTGGDDDQAEEEESSGGEVRTLCCEPKIKSNPKSRSMELPHKGTTRCFRFGMIVGDAIVGGVFCSLAVRLCLVVVVFLLLIFVCVCCCNSLTGANNHRCLAATRSLAKQALYCNSLTGTNNHRCLARMQLCGTSNVMAQGFVGFMASVSFCVQFIGYSVGNNWMPHPYM
jgi:hypothetical protein